MLGACPPLLWKLEAPDARAHEPEHTLRLTAFGRLKKIARLERLSPGVRGRRAKSPGSQPGRGQTATLLQEHIRRRVALQRRAEVDAQAVGFLGGSLQLALQQERAIRTGNQAGQA